MNQQKLSSGDLVQWIRDPVRREAGFSQLVQIYQKSSLQNNHSVGD
jgi:hypothetical protein